MQASRDGKGYRRLEYKGRRVRGSDDDDDGSVFPSLSLSL